MKVFILAGLLGLALCQTKDISGPSTQIANCNSVTCGDLKCPDGLLADGTSKWKKKNDGACCYICWANDDVVPLDRHQAYDSQRQVNQCPGAPSHCFKPGGEAECYQLTCPKEEQVCAKDACCARCKANDAFLSM